MSSRCSAQPIVTPKQRIAAAIRITGFLHMPKRSRPNRQQPKICYRSGRIRGIFSDSTRRRVISPEPGIPRARQWNRIHLFRRELNRQSSDTITLGQ